MASTPGYVKGIKMYVKTGDLKYSGTDDDVYVVLHDDLDNTSGRLELNDTFSDNFERGQIDMFKFTEDKVKRLSAISTIELWRECLLFADAWFVDYIKVENEFVGSTHMFPIHRWVPLGNGKDQGERLVIKELDSYLPCDDEDRKEQRKKELRKKQSLYQLKISSELPGMPARIVDMPFDESFSDGFKFDIQKRKYTLLFRSKLEHICSGQWKNLDDIKQIYGSEAFPVPESINHLGYSWMSDEYFAEKRIAGCNPTHIHLCSCIPTNFALTADMIEPFLEGRTLQDALQNKKLYIINHKITENLTKSNTSLTLCSPMCLFYVNNEKQLLPIAIQLFQAPAEDNPVFLPSDPEYTWLLAKMWFNNADANVHESVSHLGLNHLTMESIAIVTHRRLCQSHPLFRLLAPHFRYLIAINTLAVSKLISAGGWVDKAMTVGGTGMLHLVARGYPTWRLNVEGNLPRDLKNRGVEDKTVLPNYPYRDDGLLIYDAILNYVTEILEHVYASGNSHNAKESLSRDHELQAWARELTDPNEDGGCNMKGIPCEFSSLDDLIIVVTSIIFCCSAGHSSLNFGQYDEYAFPPAYPSIMYGTPPKDKRARTESDIISTLPGKKTTLDVMVVTRILSDRGDSSLGHFEVPYAYDEYSLSAMNKFQSNLAKAEQEIKQRHMARKMPYVTLLPSEVPNAISI